MPALFVRICVFCAFLASGNRQWLSASQFGLEASGALSICSLLSHCKLSGRTETAAGISRALSTIQLGLPTVGAVTYKFESLQRVPMSNAVTAPVPLRLPLARFVREADPSHLL